MRSYFLMGMELLFKKTKIFWGWILMTVAQHCEYTDCHLIVCLKLAKLINIRLCNFATIKKSSKKGKKLHHKNIKIQNIYTAKPFSSL